MMNLKKLLIKLVQIVQTFYYIKAGLSKNEDVTNSLERHASYNREKIFFGYDGEQNYLVFQLMYEYLKRVIVTKNNVSTIYVHF